MNWFKKKVSDCTHTAYSYKYNPDNEDLYSCDSCGIVGKLTGGEKIPNSYNMITNEYSYTGRIFTPLTLATQSDSKDKQ